MYKNSRLKQAHSAIKNYREGGFLDALTWELEAIVIALEDERNHAADQIRGAWSDLEIVNAMNLSEGLAIDRREVDELISEILDLIRKS